MSSDLTFSELQKRIELNDNRYTARPYLLLLQQKEEFVAHEDYSHDTKTVYIHHIYGDVTESESLYEMVKDLYRNGYSREDFEDRIEELKVGHHWRTDNVFLTDKGYEEHMELNGHNVSRGNGHRTYGINAFRNPEINLMFKAIEKCSKYENEIESLSKQLEKAEGVLKEISTSTVEVGFYIEPTGEASLARDYFKEKQGEDYE